MTKRGPRPASKATDPVPSVEADDISAAEAAYAAAREAYIARLTMPREQSFGEIPGYQPDWFLKAQQAELARGGSDSADYLRTVSALSAMRTGNFGPLATLLKERTELPPLIRRELVFMIEGDAEQSGGNRLCIESHPDVDKRREGRHILLSTYIRDESIAAFIASSGGFSKKLKIALFEAEKFFGIRRSQLMKIWTAHKEAVRPLGFDQT